MKLTRIVMKNWCSFYGLHELDFTGKKAESSYVIFGQIGKGKSSVVAAVEWALFGKVMDSMQDGDDHILRQKRPIVDAEQFNGEFNKFALPLLVDRAYREGDYCTEVELHFIHDGAECKLVRKALPLNGAIPLTDSDMKIHLSLSIGDDEYENECPTRDIGDDTKVQPRINEIIPKEVSRFFFVKGDAIREFTGLIFGSDNNPKMKDAVNSVVGLPALSQSVRDIQQLRSQSEEDANRLGRQANTGDKIDLEMDGIELEIKELQDGYTETDGERMQGISELEDVASTLKEEIDVLNIELGKHAEARNLMGRIEGFESQLKVFDKKLPDQYKSYKKNLENGWKIVIQKVIHDSIQRLGDEAAREDELNEKIKFLSKDIPHDLERLNSKDGAIPCATCNEIRQTLSKSERATLEESISERKTAISEHEYDLSSVEGSVKKKNVLYDFKTDINGDAITQAESLVKLSREEYDKDEELVKECKIALLDLDADGYEKTQASLKEKEKDQTLVESTLEGHRENQDRLKQKLANLRQEKARKAPPGAKANLVKAQTKIDAYEWLRSIWEISLEKYREKIRYSIDDICTKRFLEWVDEPEKYSRVETSDNWSLTVYGADDHWAPLGNPGHRQLLSVCFIESLRQNSNIEFPLIFDNPGAAVDQETISGILEFYLNNPPAQFIALSHSGGMREKEMMDKYHKSGQISKAWRVDYVSGIDRHSEFKQL